jgi:hypothetical protein
MSNFLVGRGLNDAAYDVFSGTGAQTVFSLTSASSTSAATVSISGVVQRPVTDYSVANTTLTFVAAPPSGTNNILVQYNKSITIGTPADGTITTAKIADDAVTLAKMAGGTDGNLITFDANGDPAYVATGTSGQVLTSNGAGAAPTMQDLASTGFTESTLRTLTSQSSVEWTSIPSGTTVIMIGLLDANPNGSGGVMRIVIGDSGGYETSGYKSYSSSASTGVAGTVGFAASADTTVFTTNTSAQGLIILSLANSGTNLWAMCGNLADIDQGRTIGICGGTKALSAELNRVKLELSAGTWDSGSANITYL